MEKLKIDVKDTKYIPETNATPQGTKKSGTESEYWRLKTGYENREILHTKQQGQLYWGYSKG